VLGPAAVVSTRLTDAELPAAAPPSPAINAADPDSVLDTHHITSSSIARSLQSPSLTPAHSTHHLPADGKFPIHVSRLFTTSLELVFTFTFNRNSKISSCGHTRDNGSATKRLRCDVIFVDGFITHKFTDGVRVKAMDIGQHWAKLQARRPTATSRLRVDNDPVFARSCTANEQSHDG